MDLQDLLSGDSEWIRANRPIHPDMDRLTEISLELKAETASVTSYADMETKWRERVTATGVDFDTIQWKALQIAMDICNVRTGADLDALRKDDTRNSQFISIIQAFFDGWIVHAEFLKRGGHREVGTA